MPNASGQPRRIADCEWKTGVIESLDVPSGSASVLLEPPGDDDDIFFKVALLYPVRTDLLEMEAKAFGIGATRREDID